MNGLPFEQLPADKLTPESILRNELKQEEINIRRRYDSQWNEINRRIDVLGEAKAFSAFNSIYSGGLEELNRLKANGNRKLALLKQVDVLASNGFISKMMGFKSSFIKNFVRIQD